MRQKLFVAHRVALGVGATGGRLRHDVLRKARVTHGGPRRARSSRESAALGEQALGGARARDLLSRLDAWLWTERQSIGGNEWRQAKDALLVCE